MKGVGHILMFISLLFACAIVYAQQKVQTIVPRQVIEAGNAFQVQYVVNNAADFVEMQTPDFSADFKLVSGPQLYVGNVIKGGKTTTIQNYSYTLLPLKIGKLLIPGGTFIYKNEKLKSSDAFVNVVAPIAQPGMQKGFQNVQLYAGDEASLKDQLFIEASVNKKECFVGEPVVATFKLFARVPSTSEVIKNPGFYGFSVVDVPPVSEQAETLENRNGKMYTTHILRKVQLYAAQAGQLTIDEMSVQNTINLIDNESHVISRRDYVLATKPIKITVNELPATAAKTDFNGAVGRFVFAVKLLKDTVMQNHTGKLEVSINGSGNFVQLSAPEIAWPNGIEKVAAAVTEKLNPASVPVSGNRKYVYTFSSDSAGRFTIPSLSFTYFDPADKAFHTQTTSALNFVVKSFHQPRSFFFTKGSGKVAERNIAAVLLVTLILGTVIFVYIRKRKPQTEQKGFENVALNYEEQIRSINENSDRKYAQLLQVLEEYLKKEYGIASFTKPVIRQTLQQKGFENVAVEKLLNVVNECEVVQYYGAGPSVEFGALKQQALNIFKTN